MPYRSLRIVPLTSGGYFCFGLFSVPLYSIKRMSRAILDAEIII